MALITDPDDLNDEAAYTGATEVFVDTSARTIRLTEVGNLSTDGVTMKALYSFLKEEWKNDPLSKNLAAFPFPLTPITDESFEFGDGWDYFADATRFLIRTAGWTVKNSAGNVTQKWAGIIGLGSIEADDQLYYNQSIGATDVVLTGQVNQAVQILDDPNGDGDFADGFDYRTQFDLFAREFQQLYGKSSLSDIGVTTMDSIAYRFPISTGTDLKITTADGVVGTTAPYTQIVLRYFKQAFNREVDSVTNRDYGIVVDVGTHSGVDGIITAAGTVLTTFEGGMVPGQYAGGTLRIHEGTDENTIYTIVNNQETNITISGGTFTGNESNISFTAQRAAPVVATAEEIYEKVQYLLRQNVDIDRTGDYFFESSSSAAPGSEVIGKIADELMIFVGDTLVCGLAAPVNPNGGGSGVIIEGFSANDTNRLQFYDNTATQRTFPFVASLTINFGSNLENDAAAVYRVFFTYTHRLIGTDLSIQNASGQSATLASGTTNLTELTLGEQFLVSGFSNADNNGYYEVTQTMGGTSSSSSLAGGEETYVSVKKADSGDPNFVNEGAGATVNLDMNPYGSTSAILVDDNDDIDITGTVGGATSVAKSFNYDGNVQGGRTASVDANITAMGIGLVTGQFVRATGLIAQSVTNSVSLVAPLERNYENL